MRYTFIFAEEKVLAQLVTHFCVFTKFFDHFFGVDLDQQIDNVEELGDDKVVKFFVLKANVLLV